MACNLNEPVFFASSDFNIIENEEGFFVEAFLISNKLNANNWMVTDDANKKDGQDFVGKPDIVFFKNGKRDHTVGNTKEESLRIQEPFRKGTMLSVKGTDTGVKLTTISKIEDKDTQDNLRRKEIKFVSPAVFPKSLKDVEVIRTGPNTHIHVLHRYDALHRAFVDEPAYGPEATVGPVCEGDGSDCMIKLEQVQAGIGDGEVEPLREKKIVSVKKCTLTGNTIVEFENTSLNQQKSSINEMSDADKIKDLEAKLAKKAEELDEQKKSNEELTKEKEKETEKAKKAEEEKKKLEEESSNDESDEDKKKKEEAKKAEEQKKTDEENKEKEMSARIASEIAEKLPLIEKFVAAKTNVAGLDEKAVNELREEMMKASLDDVKKSWDNIKDFVANIPMKNTQQESTIGYGATNQSFVASTGLEKKSTEELLKIVGIDN